MNKTKIKKGIIVLISLTTLYLVYKSCNNESEKTGEVKIDTASVVKFETDTISVDSAKTEAQDITKIK